MSGISLVDGDSDWVPTCVWLVAQGPGELHKGTVALASTCVLERVALTVSPAALALKLLHWFPPRVSP